MLKIKSLNKFISIGLLSVFMFVGSFMFVYAEDAVTTGGLPAITTDDSFTKDTLTSTITSILNYVIGLVAIVAVIMIVWAGYLYITAGMDEKNVDKAKKMLLWGVIGIIIVVLSYSIVGFAASFLS